MEGFLRLGAAVWNYFAFDVSLARVRPDGPDGRASDAPDCIPFVLYPSRTECLSD